MLAGWSDALMAHTITHWDDDTGGRSTRDYIEENVVEAIADALDVVAEDETRETWLYVIDMLAARVDLFNKPHTDWPVQMHLLHVATL